MRSATVVLRTSEVIYLSTDDGAAIALHDVVVPSCPFSVIVEAPVATLALELGDRVELGDGFLVSNHRRVNARPPALPAAPCAGPPLAAFRELGRLVPNLLQRVPQLAPALRPLELWAADEVGADRTVERVIGWGEGLTPSGDDALIGFLAAHSLARDGDRRELAELRSAIAREAPGRTTFVSSALLIHASAGRFSQPIDALRGAHSAHALARLANRLARVGGTSGLDTLAGVWLAARTTRGSVAAGDTLGGVATRSYT